MSRSLVQPIGQKRLTNVAVVRLKKHGNRFEIACFKNKVLSWRSRVEKDLDEVLQTRTVYSNVSKGVLAKAKELQEAFGTTDEEKICLEILEKGELQVAGKEREVQLSSQFRDIAGIVVEKTLNPETERPYTISMIERFMREIHFAVDPHRTSKKQALELIRELQEHFPIARAQMRLKLTVPADQKQKVLESLAPLQARIESEQRVENLCLVICRVEPGHFRACDAIIRECGGKLDVIAMAVHKEEDEEEDHEHRMQKRNISPEKRFEGVVASFRETGLSESKRDSSSSSTGKKCLTCDSEMEAKDFREHCKSEWHKHNMKRKARQLPPLSAEECAVDSSQVSDRIDDLDEYYR